MDISIYSKCLIDRLARAMDIKNFEGMEESFACSNTFPQFLYGGEHALFNSCINITHLTFIYVCVDALADKSMSLLLLPPPSCSIPEHITLASRLNYAKNKLMGFLAFLDALHSHIFILN